MSKTWIDQLFPIIAEYRGEAEEDQSVQRGREEPLDGDEVERLCHIIKCKINLHEGNITEEEYEELIDKKATTFIENVVCPLCMSANFRDDYDHANMECCERCGAEWIKSTGEIICNPKDL